MKKYLLPQAGNFYKANLHCHSTFSDGNLTPQALKEAYMKEGYSIIAYTDHDVLIAHPELADENFLPLNGYEMEIDDRTEDFSMRKTCHMCLISLDPENLTQACYHRTKYLFGNAVKYRDRLKFDASKPDFEREHTPECINAMVKEARENGFFVTYNHPAWSLENYGDYGKYRGFHAMEICNYGCEAGGFPDYNEQVYDDMLRTGERLFCIAADDTHSPEPSLSNGCFGGFTVFKAETLNYNTIANALLAGNFYASQGPEIYDLWYEDGKITVNCSNALKIALSTARRRTETAWRKDGEELLSATFNVLPEDGYVRITVTDDAGRHANTNAYFTDELLK